jgi:hypothetical protein
MHGLQRALEQAREARPSLTPQGDTDDCGTGAAVCLRAPGTGQRLEGVALRAAQGGTNYVGTQ